MREEEAVMAPEVQGIAPEGSWAANDSGCPGDCWCFSAHVPLVPQNAGQTLSSSLKIPNYCSNASS